MGEEINASRFIKADYQQFEKKLRDETALLKQWFDSHAFASSALVSGYELEAWLVDHYGYPWPNNETFLDQANTPLLSPELARFNVELNVEPETVNSNLLQHLEQQLSSLWLHCQQSAQLTGCNILGTGILPTLKDSDLTLANLSTLKRYKALNEQVLRHQRGETIKLNINGIEHLQVAHNDVMLEAAATSLQIHLQVPQSQAVRYYNAAIIVSAPMVAIGANSPFLFGKALWEETRIPVFEQSVPTGGIGGAAKGPMHRVSFGSGYARESLFECFQENLEHYPVLLPVNYDNKLTDLRHLRLHNGTIWRWNRPLIGFDTDGKPHLRIEHRVIASAPSMLDNIANMAFYYGLVHYYASAETPPETQLDFADAKDNFYRSAQLGIHHRLLWTDAARQPLQQLILEKLLLQAETGLHKLGIDATQCNHYLSIIEKRISSGQTGSAWQQEFARIQHRDMALLTQTYFNNQQTGRPVHEWDFETH